MRNHAMFALIDCNNFYASCERLFRPDLKDRPIVVLSNNDGCCIARSNEAKVLGIGMGEPYFKIKNLCNKYQVHIFSSNYTLYGDISHRVMLTIEAQWPRMEIYSIDEAFIDLTAMPEHEQEAFCIALQKIILKHTGIPTSIGMGPTKTLAKMANYFCKKIVHQPVFNLQNNLNLLAQVPVEEVWGVGRKLHHRLTQLGIKTAKDLAEADSLRLKTLFSVVMMRLGMELQGTPCGGIEEYEPQKSILSSKSFGQMQTEFESIAEALSSHCARAAEKLRKHQLMAQRVTVFLQTNKHRKDLAQHKQSLEVVFAYPTDDVRKITSLAKDCLTRLFRPGYSYKKVGIHLAELLPKAGQQLDLFQPISPELQEKSEHLLLALEAVNRKFGKSTLRLAAEGYSKPWKMRSEMKSPAYTTSWSDIPRVMIY